ncbi:MAG: hypothetical protein ACLUSP_07745 [Christensenellales bacterium]
MLSLPIGENVPMIAMISRLVSHKGFDIVRSAFNDILRDNVQFVVLGTATPNTKISSATCKAFTATACAVL